MYLKQLFCTLLFAASVFSAFAQDGEDTPPVVDLAKIVQPGTKLIYDVEANDQKYQFIVTVKDVKGMVFDWEMTAPVSLKGSITHTAKGRANASLLYNYFTAGPKKLDDKTTSVWLSEKLLKELETKQFGTPVKPYGPTGEAIMMGTFTGEIPFEIMVDGKAATIITELAKQLKKGSDGKEVIVASGDEAINFISNKAFPLITRMKFDFFIILKEVRTKG